ncbi:hypothetical protein HII28_00320 [Planctomonas sp. JC2975]|uniref:permease prefix domain 1-containing protein n=1 Tax=Planctomonas sp. JC2975 TaxID=2729626 RepID=UPI00147646F9|nr:permease prefix domain 1-containing protein [Planctomonas sp. JC2975]NNC10329.1 hypothetical protein [Planctomonas sp. JC2975]
MSTKATNEYIAAVARRVPQRKRNDVEAELRALIADEIDARLEAGEPEAEAERAVLRELGEPGVLAERYSPGSRVLLSRHVFRAWARTCGWSCAIVLPIVYAVLVVVRTVSGDNPGAIVFLPLGTTITVAMYLLVAITALFAVVDRHDARLGSGLGDDRPGDLTGRERP